METPRDTPADPERESGDGGANQLGYRNVDEDAEHDESGGTQGRGAEELPPDET